MIRAILFTFIFCLPCFASPETNTIKNSLEQKEKEFWPETKPEETLSQKKEYSPRGLLTKTVLLVISLSGAVMAGGWFLKKMTGERFNSFHTEGRMVLVEKKHLSPKTSLWLTEIDSQRVVIVESVHGVALHPLQELSPQDVTHV